MSLWFALIPLSLSAGMLLAVNASVREHGRPTYRVFLWCFFLSGGTHLCVVYMLPLLIQGLLLSLTLPLAWIPERGVRVYRNTSIGITAAIWLLVLANFGRLWVQYDDWQQQVPFETMADRVPVPVRRGSADGESWHQLEDTRYRTWRGRGDSLQAVHARRVELFADAAGFGSLRMSDHSPKAQDFGPDRTPPIPQPERYDPNAVSLGEDVPDAARKPFPTLHANSLLDFSYPDGFGYVKGRNAVAGFRPHRFSKVPEPVERWEVRRLELVGLLLHTTPKVYVSDNLPRMAEVKRLPTRDLDSFEADGLTAIQRGDDLYSRGDRRDARMVGAIRSVSQCVECHGGQRGDLLGAFSYRLRHEAE